MPIQNVSSIVAQPVGVKMNQPVHEVENGQQTAFKDLLKSAISEVNDAQLKSDAATELLARGGNIDLHEVMITAQKASITLQTALQIRNKAVEAYQEIMRMQV